MGNACGNKQDVRNVRTILRPTEHPYKKSLKIFSDNILKDLIQNFGSSEANENYNQQA